MGEERSVGPIDYWRERIFRSMLLVAIWLGLVLYVPSMLLAVLYQQWLFTAVNSFVYGCVISLHFIPRVSLKIRAFALLAVVYLLSIFVMIYVGPLGMVYLLTASVAATLFFNARAALFSILLNVAIVTYGGFNWPVTYSGYALNLVDLPLAWLVLALSFGFLNTLATVSVSMLVRGLQHSLEKERAISTALELEQQHILETHDRLKREVIERYRAEKERLRLAMAVDQAAEVILITDTQGCIQYVNPAFERMSGHTRRRVLGVCLREGKNAIREDELWSAVDRGEPWAGRAEGRHRSGSEFQVEMTVSPVRDEHGEIINFVAVMRDITREMQIEEQLRRSQKLEAIGTLAGGIAHDFNNILMSIFGFTELTKAGLPPTSAMQTYLDEILRGSQRARDLVQQILTFSRQIEAARQPVAVGLLVTEALRLLRASIPTTIEIVNEVEADVGTVFANPTQVHQVVMNLCTNAYHAMESKGGTLHISLVRLDATPDLLASAPRLREGHSYVCLAVRDTGVGMERKTLERIFDPFFTTKEQGKGTGLGLATVHGIITALGGDITVTSEPGAGSEFRVYLPRVEAPIQPVLLRDADEPQGDGEHIILVDDETVLLQLGEDMLRSLNYEVTVCQYPEEALSLILASPQRYASLITDQTMPVMTGLELARQVRACAPDMPVIIVSGYTESFSPERLSAVGVRGFLQKPYTRSDLARILHSALRSTPWVTAP